MSLPYELTIDHFGSERHVRPTASTDDSDTYAMRYSRFSAPPWNRRSRKKTIKGKAQLVIQSHGRVGIVDLVLAYCESWLCLYPSVLS